MTRHFRTLWLSGLHLGSGACRSRALLDFLAATETRQLYLLGDIVDCAGRAGRVRFPAGEGEVWLALARLARNGTRVTYLPGHSDADPARHARALGAVSLAARHVHETADGRRLLVCSGFEFDAVVRRELGLDRYAPLAYPWLEHTHARFEALRAALGAEFSPAAAGVRRRLAEAQAYRSLFRSTVARRALDAACDGVACGWLHQPALDVTPGFVFGGAGDWVIHQSALAETDDGTFELLEHDAAADRHYSRLSVTTLAA